MSQTSQHSGIRPSECYICGKDCPKKAGVIVARNQSQFEIACCIQHAIETTNRLFGDKCVFCGGDTTDYVMICDKMECEQKALVSIRLNRTTIGRHKSDISK